MQRTRLAAALSTTLSAAFIPTALAASLPPAEYTLEEIVVTATRIPTPATRMLTAATVVTRADIMRSQAKTLADLLAGAPGLEFVNNGGIGKSTNILMRGTQQNHVVVLLDGVKLGSATTGQVAIQDLPLADIERIEIVPGPNSALYGSEAIGGVIQVFTRKGGGQPALSANAGFGSHGTYEAAANFSGGGEQGWLNLSARSFSTDGFSVQNGSETDADGYRNLSFALRAGRELAPGSEADFTLLRAAGDNKFDGTAQNEAETMQSVLGFGLKHRIGETWTTRIQLGRSRDESDNLLNGVFKSRFNTRRDSASWQNDLNLLARTTLSLGLDWQDDAVASSVAYTVKNRDNTGVFAQLQAGVGAHDFRVALRHDNNSQFGSNSTGNVAWGMDLGAGLRSRVSYGTAFKAPTFNELYYPNFGNAALQPEKSQSLEAGIDGVGLLRWSATLFENRITDLIGFDGTTNPSNATARIRGLESKAQTRLADWDLRAALTLQEPENRSETVNKGKQLNRRAQQHLRLDVDRDFGAWRLGATLRLEGKRYDNLANTVKLGGYGLLDLRGEARMAKDWRLQARVENLFDKTYETAAGYNQPGVGAYVNLVYQPVK